MYNEVLEQIGLTPEQAEIYQALLEEGPQTASKLDSLTSVSRTYVYQIAEELQEMGLITKKKDGRTTIFTALSPETLLTQAETEKMRLERATHALEGVLPDLKSKYAASAERPVVTYYEGSQGIKKVMEDIISPKNEPLLGCMDLDLSNKLMPGHITEKIAPRRIQNNVFAKAIFTASLASRKLKEKDSEQMREIHLVDKDVYPLPAEIDVYEDKVAIISFDSGKPIGMIIQNQDVATTLKSVFRLAFETAESS